MCHASPTAELLGFVIVVSGSLYVAHHVWCFDRGKCLRWPTRRTLFRWIMCWNIVLSLLGFIIWGALQTTVKYKHGYAAISIAPGVTKVAPVPFTLWPESDQHMVKVAYHIASVAWALMIVLHGEETLYWHYLFRSIRRQSTVSWFKSWHFKLLILIAVCSFATFISLPIIAGSNLLQAEEDVFLAGGFFASVLLAGTIWLQLAFPGFIRESARRGINADVLARLTLFKNLHTLRLALRTVFAVCILALSIDGLTETKHVNTTPLTLDRFYLGGFLSVFVSTTITVMILLPRSMSSEAGVLPSATVFIRPYRLRSRPGGPLNLATGGQLVIHPLSESSDTLTDKRRPASASGHGSGAFSPYGVAYNAKDVVGASTAHGEDDEDLHLDLDPDPWDILGDALDMHEPINPADGKREAAPAHAHAHVDDDTPERPDKPFAAGRGARALTGLELERMQSRAAPVDLNSFVSPVLNAVREERGPGAGAPIEVVVHTETTVLDH